MVTRIERHKWQKMTDDEVIEFWKSHNYSKTLWAEKNVSGFGFSSWEACDNYYNCKAQMCNRNLL